MHLFRKIWKYLCAYATVFWIKTIGANALLTQGGESFLMRLL
jgi:hypothetical protein